MYKAMVTFNKRESNGSYSNATSIVSDDHFEVLVHLACSWFDHEGLGCEPISSTQFSIGDAIYTFKQMTLA